MKQLTITFALALTLIPLTGWGAEPDPWDIESVPAEQREQPIDVTEGTWINLDVSPDGKTIVFDLLGDLYQMPISGADGSQGRYPIKLTSGVAWDMQPRFSPDGRQIAFTSDRRGKSGKAGDNIWILQRNADGEPGDELDARLRQVTNETYRLVTGAAWTPDGQYLVARKHFTSRRSLGAGEMWLYHHAAAESNAFGGLPLTSRPNDQKDVNEPIFSPDGRYLYYSLDATPGATFEYDKDSHAGIYAVRRLDRQTGETETVISGPGGACRPTPSPDGKTIAFVRRVGANTGLHLYDTRSGAIRLVYDQLERDMQEAWAIHGVYPTIAWTPDGQSIVAWAKGKIRRIQVTDGAAEVIPFHIKDTRKIAQSLRYPIEVAPDEVDIKMLRWVTTSPNGKQVAYQALGHIYVKDLPDGEPRRLTQQTEHFEFFPSYSRDGRHIVYATWHDQKLGSVRVASADASLAENWSVTSQPGHYAYPVFSPDGQTIVFQRNGGGGLISPLWSRDRGLYRVGRHGGDMSLVSKTGSRPHFGADNDRVFYQTTQSTPDADNRKLFSVALDGTEAREHYSSQWATDFQVSPDGQWIAFIERFHVFVAPLVLTGRSIPVGPQATGLPVAKVTQQAGDYIHFSGDSQQIHWSLGPDYYSQSLEQAFAHLRPSPPLVEPKKKKKKNGERSDEPSTAEVTATSVPIGMRVAHDRPDGRLALVGGRIVTMDRQGIIPNGTILIEGNRIVTVGPTNKVRVPQDAKVIQLRGQVVLPGFVDTHAHGAQATNEINPQQSWVDMARLAFGVTTIHDPSHSTHNIFSSSELAKTGRILAPRTFSTGTILYGATGSYKAEVDSLDDALFHLRRMQAVGAFSVKSYNQPRRNQRQQVIEAAREQGVAVVPEGGSLYHHNMTMIVDGHTGIEHSVPVERLYDDAISLWSESGTGYTPTLTVAYGGSWGENYWYQTSNVWEHERLLEFVPREIVDPRSRRRVMIPEEELNHISIAREAARLVQAGGRAQLGAHGQMQGLAPHWELWMFEQGGMTPHQAWRAATLDGARYLGLDGDLGSLEPGKLADLIVVDGDPLKSIRRSENVRYTMINGRLFDAATMNEIAPNAAERPAPYWRH